VKNISAWLYKISTGFITLIGLVTFILFTALVLPNQSAQSNVSYDGAITPDLSFYYSSTDLYRSAEVYGETGRDAYIRTRFTFDLVWPLVYAFFLTTSVSWLFARGFSEESIWRYLNILPLAGMLMDYLENICTSVVMWRFPVQTLVLDDVATIFTMLKWIFLTISFLALGIGLLVATWQWMIARTSKAKRR